MDFLDNEEISTESRLYAAKMIIELRDQEIDKLRKQLDYDRSTKNWAADQEGIQRMGL